MAVEHQKNLRPDAYKFPLASILDNDLYKFTMQQAVWRLYPDIDVSYEFTNRSAHVHRYTQEALECLQQRVNMMDSLRLTPAESEFLRNTCPYLSDAYISYLDEFRFKPREHVTLVLDDSGDLHVMIRGKWVDTILYEIPLLALISETYFERVDADWNLDGQVEKATEKGRKLLQGGCRFSEFGTRRRRCLEVHDLVVQELVKVAKECHGDGAYPGTFVGTSNVYLAMKHGTNPSGSVAHEWTMALSALDPPLQKCAIDACLLWSSLYPTPMCVALPDTFTTPFFFAHFPADLIRQFRTFRQDSGNPQDFVDVLVRWCEKNSVDLDGLVILFSDSLDVEKAVELRRTVELGIGRGLRAAFGIGTNFTNDFTRSSDPTTSSPAMNIVIKLTTCNGKPVVKLSDEKTKRNGKSVIVQQVWEEVTRDIDQSVDSVGVVGRQAITVP